MASNPFVASGATSTPYIPNLPTVGAEIAGLLPGLSYGTLPSTDTNGTSLSKAFGALILLPSSVLGNTFTGYNLLVDVNLHDTALNNPELGVNGACTALQTMDVAHGNGSSVLASLAVGGIYVTLIPTGSNTSHVQFTNALTNNATGSLTVAGGSLASANVLYVIPEPGSWLLMAIGGLLAAYGFRRRSLV